MNKKMNTANTKLCRAEARLAEVGVRARSRSRSHSCSRSRSPPSTSRSARCRSRYSPPPSQEHSSRDRGREFRARTVRRTDQFALDLNSANEYRNVSNAQHGRRK